MTFHFSTYDLNHAGGYLKREFYEAPHIAKDGNPVFLGFYEKVPVTPEKRVLDEK